MTARTSPLLAALALMIAATFVGMLPVVKLIRVYEVPSWAETWIRTITGWSIIFFWLMTTWFVATIIGDWGVSGDLQGAVDRPSLRLRIIIEIAAEIADSD